MDSPTRDNEDLRDKPIGELVGQLSTEISTLVRQEIELAAAMVRGEVERARTSLREDVEIAKSELSEKAGHAGRGAGLFGAAAVAAVLALGTLTAFAVLALDGAMDNWLAALIIGLVWAAAAALFAMRGRDEVRKVGSPVPQRALAELKQDAERSIDNLKADAEESAESIKEDVQWAKTQSKSDSK